MRNGTVTASEVWKRFRVDSRPTYLQDQLGRVADYVRRKETSTWRWVLRDIEFQAEPGESWALVGANGAGKSTLLKLLAGALPADTGERRVGHNVTVGYYTQHREEMLDPDRTALENALARARGQTETKVRALLGAFLFPGDDAKKKAAVLSGGEKSRLALALILLDPPSVLLMDEPTIHLDVPSVDALVGALRDFEGALGFVSHDVHFIRSVADRVVRIEAGRVTDYPGDWDYYCWRRAQPAGADDEPRRDPDGDGRGRSGERRPAAATEPGSALGAAAGAAERSGRGFRRQRRQAAEARAALSRRLRPLREEASRLEGEIEDLEREKAGIEGDLADPATYAAAAGADLAGLRRRHADVASRLSAASERWLEVEMEIETITEEEDPDEPTG